MQALPDSVLPISPKSQSKVLLRSRVPKGQKTGLAAKEMQKDKAYRLNQKDAQERWAAKRPNYWRNYRKQHPEYVKRNREKQQRRNQVNRGLSIIADQIAMKKHSFADIVLKFDF